MAASYVRALRSTVKGLHLDPGRRLLLLLTHSSQTPAWSCQCARPQAARCRLLHVSPAASLSSSSSSRTEPPRSRPTEGRRAREEEEEEGPEDRPHRTAKNPMIYIGYAWMIGLPTGIIGFILAKRQVDKNRLKQLKVRQRMSMSNEGDYEGSRYHRHSEGVNADQ